MPVILETPSSDQGKKRSKTPARAGRTAGMELPTIRTFSGVGPPLLDDRTKPRCPAGLLSAVDQTSRPRASWRPGSKIAAMSGAEPGILLLSELYPPTIGGSGVLLESLYSRLTDVQVNVLTGAGGARIQRSLRVSTMPMAAPDWGLIRPQSLARHVRIARQVRRLTSPGTIIHCGRGLPVGGRPDELVWRAG